MQHIAALGRAVTPHDNGGSGTAIGRVLVAFDGDDAGRHAAGATWPLLQAASAGAALVTSPAGTDPSDAGPDLLCAALYAASPPARVLRHSGLWRLLGLPVRHTYQAVLRYPGISATDLAPHAGLVHAPDSAPTSSQLRTLDEHLQTLAGLGLVQVEPDGT